MQRRKPGKAAAGRARGEGKPEVGKGAASFVAATLEAIADALTTGTDICNRACPCEGKSAMCKTLGTFPNYAGQAISARSLLEPGAPIGPALNVATETVAALLPILYERSERLDDVVKYSPILRTRIAASMTPPPLIMASLTPENFDEVVRVLAELALALEEAANDASPEDARRLRMLGAQITLLIARLRAGATLVELEFIFVNLIDEILALLTRLPATIARVVAAKLMAVINLFTRLGAAAGGSGWLALLGKALLVLAVFLAAHFATRWVLENCRYEGVRLWDLLDENPIFDWAYGVGGALTRCDILYRAYLSLRRQRRSMQQAGLAAPIIGSIAAAEAAVLAVWIDECVDAAQKPFWQRELARVRALI